MFINCMGFLGDILLAQRYWWGCKLYGCNIWREDIVVPYVTTYAVALQMRLRMYVMGKYIGEGNNCGDIFGEKFYAHTVSCML